MADTLYFNADTVKDVVQHMNEDHADSCLAMARSLGGRNDAQRAIMQSMDSLGVDLLVQFTEHADDTVRIPFDKPILHEGQIRGRIVSLARKAREI